MENLFRVLRTIGIMDAVVKAADPDSATVVGDFAARGRLTTRVDAENARKKK